MGVEGATDREIAALAGAQHGVASRAQLVDLGLTRDEIGNRLERGRLHVIHRGVYAVGHRVMTKEGRWMAATLATGGVLSHATAAAAWELLPVGAGAIHVTIPGDPGRRRRAGIHLHRSRTLTPQDTTTLNGIGLTTRERTIADLSRTTKGRRLEHFLDRAERHLDFARLRQLAPPSLQAVLATYTTTVTRSELEEAFLRLCDNHGLPRPQANTRIEGIEVDFVWRDQQLIVEVDGYDFHKGPSKFEADRERDVILATRGWRVLRFTYRHVTTRSGWVADAIRLAWRPA
jgi:very-short-patch-repair endonuclease